MTSAISQPAVSRATIGFGRIMDTWVRKERWSLSQLKANIDRNRLDFRYRGQDILSLFCTDREIGRQMLGLDTYTMKSHGFMPAGSVDADQLTAAWGLVLDEAFEDVPSGPPIYLY